MPYHIMLCRQPSLIGPCGLAVVLRVAVRRAGGLLLTYYPLGYPISYMDFREGDDGKEFSLPSVVDLVNCAEQALGYQTNKTQ
jgi:hypothetical protein